MEIVIILRIRRSVFVRDKNVKLSTVSRPKADPSVIGQVGAPMKGDIVDVKVAVGDKVEKGQVLAVVSAMKMEMAVQAPLAGKIKKVLVNKGDQVQGDDFIVEVE